MISVHGLTIFTWNLQCSNCNIKEKCVQQYCKSLKDSACSLSYYILRGGEIAQLLASLSIYGRPSGWKSQNSIRPCQNSIRHRQTSICFDQISIRSCQTMIRPTQITFCSLRNAFCLYKAQFASQMNDWTLLGSDHLIFVGGLWWNIFVFLLLSLYVRWNHLIVCPVTNPVLFISLTHI